MALGLSKEAPVVGILVEKLNFKWDEVHEMAEELEHILSV